MIIKCPLCGLVEVEPDSFVYVPELRDAVPCSGWCTSCDTRLLWRDGSGNEIEPERLVPPA